MTVTCDVCGEEIIITTIDDAEIRGWIVAEDEPDATELHGLCPACPDESD